MRRRQHIVRVVVPLVVATALAFLFGAAIAYGDRHTGMRTCISAIGPVNAEGEGDTTPAVAGDCP